MKKNSWIDDETNQQIQQYLDEADDFVIERNTTRNILVQLFGYRFPSPEGLHLLELGCGNGFITAEVFRMYPNNTFTLLDGNEEMLKQAKTHFNGDRFKFIQGSLEGYFNQPRGKYEFIYSSNAIHHLSLGEKKRLYQNIYEALTHNGMFINIDVVRPPSNLCEQWQFNLWQDWMAARQVGKGSANPHRYDTLPQEYKAKEENQPSGLVEQLLALQEIGFRDVDCYYKYSIFAVYGGAR